MDNAHAIPNSSLWKCHLCSRIQSQEQPCRCVRRWPSVTPVDRRDELASELTKLAIAHDAMMAVGFAPPEQMLVRIGELHLELRK